MTVSTRILTTAVALVLTTLVSRSVHAQRSVTVVGVVRDSATGEVLPNAHVQIATLGRETQTNADGRFALLGVPVGAHKLDVRYIGYRPASRSIHTDSLAAPAAPLVVRLRRAVQQLDTAVVTGAITAPAEIAATPSQISISTTQVASMPSVGEVDVFRTLQMLPGVRGAGDGTASLSVRGGTPDQNLVLLDGMTVYHVDHFFGMFSAFNTDALKDIQFFAGGFPSRYGGRLSSVVDLTGKAGDEQSLRASGGLNLLSGRGVVEVPLGRGALLVSARRSYTDVIRSRLYNNLFDIASGGSSNGSTPPGGGPTSGGGRRIGGAAAQSQNIEPTFYFYDFNSKLTYRPSRRDVAAVSLYRGKDHLDQSQSIGGGPGGIGGATTLDDFTTWGNSGVSARWFRQWAGRFSSDLILASSRYTSDGDRGMSGGTPTGARFNFGFTERNVIDDRTVRLDNELQLAPWSRVAFGTQVTDNRVTYDFIVDQTDTLQASRNTSRRSDALLTAAYLQHTWSPFAAIDLTTGVRLNRYDAASAEYLEPRVSLGIQVTPWLRLKGAWGEYHQFVKRVENEDVLQGSRDFWLLADTSLAPSAAVHSIAGFTLEFPEWSFNAEAYDKRLSDVTLFSRRYRQAFGVNTGSFFFTGDGRTRGVETLLMRNRGAVTGWLAYTLSEATETYPEVDYGATFPSSQDQRHEAKGFAVYRLRRWEFATTMVFATGRPYTLPESQYEVELLDGTTQTYVNVGPKNGARLPAYARADLGVSRRWESERLLWKVGLSLYNVTNRHNVSYRKFDLSQSPILITDVRQLGFTPSLDLTLSLKDVPRPWRSQ